MKRILIHRAAKTFELRSDVILRAMNGIGCRRVRTEAHEFRHVIVGLGAVKSAGLGSRRSLLIRGNLRRRCRRGGARSNIQSGSRGRRTMAAGDQKQKHGAKARATSNQ